MSWVVTIPTGSATATIDIVPEIDKWREDPETVILTVHPYWLSETPYRIGESDDATVTIKDGWGRVTIEPGEPASLNEDSAGAMAFTLTHWGSDGINSDEAVNVALAISGSANIGPSIATGQWRQAHDTDQDYFIDDGYLFTTPDLSQLRLNNFTSQILYSSIMVRTLYVYPTADGHVEPDETVGLAIASVLIDRQADDLPGSADSLLNDVQFMINNDDSPAMVSIEATDAQAAEGTNNIDPFDDEPDVSSDIGKFTVSRSGPTTFPLQVAFTVSGDADRGPDYDWSQSEDLFTIPSGSSSLEVTVTPRHDRKQEAAETVTVTINDVYGDQTIEPTVSAATVTIADNDGPENGWVFLHEPPGFNTTYTAWQWIEDSSAPLWDGYWMRGKHVRQYEVASTINDLTDQPNEGFNDTLTATLSSPHQIGLGVDFIVVEVNYAYAFRNPLVNDDTPSLIEVQVNESAPGDGWILGRQWRLLTEYVYEERVYDLGPDLEFSPAANEAGEQYVEEIIPKGMGYTGANVAIFKRQVPE